MAKSAFVPTRVDALCPRCLKPTLLAYEDGDIVCEYCCHTVKPISAVPAAEIGFTAESEPEVL